METYSFKKFNYKRYELENTQQMENNYISEIEYFINILYYSKMKKEKQNE